MLQFCFSITKETINIYVREYIHVQKNRQFFPPNTEAWSRKVKSKSILKSTIILASGIKKEIATRIPGFRNLKLIEKKYCTVVIEDKSTSSILFDSFAIRDLWGIEELDTGQAGGKL